MKRSSLRLLITVVAFVVIAVRFVNPNLSLDQTTLVLLGIAALPWLPSMVKSVEAFGVKLEFQSHGSDAASQPKQGLQTPTSAAAAPEPRQAPVLPASARSSPPAIDVPAEIRADSALDAFLKLTPIEAIAVFLITNAIVTASESPLLMWINFLVMTALTSALIVVLGVKRISQVVLSTGAFVAWVAAIGGPFTTIEGYTPLLGAVVLTVYSVLAPLLLHLLSPEFR